MLLKSMLHLFAVIFLADISLACSCAFEGGFLELAPKTDLILEGTVLEHKQVSGANSKYFVIKVEKVHHGQYSEETLHIWGDNGYQCRRSVSEFEVGSRWLFAIDRLPGEGATHADYFLSVCGEYALRMQGAFVSGVVEGRTRFKKQMVLAEFYPRLGAAIKE